MQGPLKHVWGSSDMVRQPDLKMTKSNSSFQKRGKMMLLKVTHAQYPHLPVSSI